ncbi:MAG: hypothetical protein HOO20_15660 [Rhodospirillaceae bacterium]|nr:hypothetical protein [Rhodospirillaceae bacterium]
MGRKAWQLKPVGIADVVSPRQFKKTAKGGKSKEWTAYKRKPTRHRDGKWFAHGLEVFQIWWEFLVRAYQSEGIEVDEDRYRDWGPKADYLMIDIWSSKSRKDGFWKFWTTYGVNLFAEADDRGIHVHSGDASLKMSDDKFYLEIPKGIPAKELTKAVKRLIEEHAKSGRKAHISTAIETITAREIRADSYRRWIKIWDMRYVPSPQFNGKYPDEDRDGDVFSQKLIDEMHGNAGYDNLHTTYRNLWKARKIVKNVAKGEFPGKVI